MTTTDLEKDLDNLEVDDTIVPPEEKKETPPAAAPTDDLKSAVANLAATVKDLKKPEERPEPELTQDQKDELWAIYKPETSRADFMKKFFRLNPDATEDDVKEARELFGDMQKGLVRQSVTGARNLMAVEMQKLRDDLKDVFSYVSEAKAEKDRKNFYEAYPALDDPKFAKVVTAMSKQLSGKDFKTRDEYFKELAEGSAEAIKGLVPEFDLSSTKTKKEQPAGTTPRLPRSTQGGSGGAGGGRQGSVTQVTSKNGGDIDALELD